MHCTDDQTEPSCQYCRSRARRFAIHSPSGYPSYVCADCFQSMADAGRPCRQTPAANSLRTDIPRNPHSDPVPAVPALR